MTTHELGICMRLMAISKPFDAGRYVELKFVIPECGEVAGGGDLTLRVDAIDHVGRVWMLGDEYYITMRSL